MSKLASNEISRALAREHVTETIALPQSLLVRGLIDEVGALLQSFDSGDRDRLPFGGFERPWHHELHKDIDV